MWIYIIINNNNSKMFHIFHEPSVLYDAKKIVHTNNNTNNSKKYTYTLNIKVVKCYNKMEK